MYSLVLMTAMSTTSSASDFNGFFQNLFSFRGGCNGGCSGCTGCSGCSGNGCSGASTYNSCSGCNGCSGESGFRARVRRLFGCNGCSGGCNGGSGCCGGGCGGGCSGMAMSMGCYGGMPPGGQPYYNLPPMPGGPSAAPTIPYAPPEAAPPIVTPERTGLRPAGGLTPGTPTSTGTGRGSVVIRLPVDARLYAGDRPLNLTGGERRFVTPELPAGQEYTYRFRVEYERDGETISVAKRVAVRTGATASVEFADLTTVRPRPTQLPPTVERPPVVATATAAARTPVPSVQPEPATPHLLPNLAGERATITIRLPAGAVLSIDDRKSPSSEPVRSFATPPLAAGKEYAYLMKAEMIRDGRPETLIQKVPFRAGERITVDFTSLGGASAGR